VHEVNEKFMLMESTRVQKVQVRKFYIKELPSTASSERRMKKMYYEHLDYPPTGIK
jgi:hypothetical protein